MGYIEIIVAFKNGHCFRRFASYSGNKHSIPYMVLASLQKLDNALRY